MGYGNSKFVSYMSIPDKCISIQTFSLYFILWKAELQLGFIFSSIIQSEILETISISNCSTAYYDQYPGATGATLCDRCFHLFSLNLTQFAHFLHSEWFLVDPRTVDRFLHRLVVDQLSHTEMFNSLGGRYSLFGIVAPRLKSCFNFLFLYILYIWQYHK